jgi:hypothetical protein
MPIESWEAESIREGRVHANRGMGGRKYKRR